MTHDLVLRAKEDHIKFISLQFTDILGTIKSVTIPVDQLESALENGVWFDGSSVQGFARIYESDRVLRLDPETYRVLPWSIPERRRARILCDIYESDGSPSPSDSRGLLKRLLAQARQRGFIYNTGPELEFFLLKRDNNGLALRPVPHDVAGYFDFSPRDEAQQVRSEIVIALQAMDIMVEASHHECAPGQHEIDFRYADALTSADNAVTLKYTVRAIANSFNLCASFMPKPIFGVNGSGMHVHQSISSPDGKNLFYDAQDPYHLSKLAYAFIAGQLAHARGMSAILSPTVNSYKRLTPGFEAPVYVCWANRNRSALIRVPSVTPGHEKGTRIELRCPDPSANPYLAFSVMLVAGLDGVDRNLQAPDPINEDVYHLDEAERLLRNILTLPGTLDEALDEFAKDDLVRSTLGEAISETVLRARRAEWDEYRIRVSDWEVERYLETA